MKGAKLLTCANRCIAGKTPQLPLPVHRYVLENLKTRKNPYSVVKIWV